MTIIRTFDTEEKKPVVNWRTKKVGAVASVLLGLLVVMQIWANNTLVVYGEKFEEISYLNQNLIMENQVLENKIATLSSLNNIATKSGELGLSTPKAVQYLH